MNRHFRNASLAICILAAAISAAENPFVGTWKLNPEKSKLTGSGLGQNATVRIETDGDGLKVSVEATTPQGQPNNFTYQASLDGKPGTVNGSSMMDTVILHRVNDHTITATGQKDGKPVFNDRRVVSKDGKTMTITRSGTNSEGQKFNATMVFDKQ